MIQNHTIYIQDFFYNTVWLNEIKHQIDKCTQIMIHYGKLMAGNWNNGDDYSIRNDKKKKIIESSYEMLIKALVVTYLNYELFWRQQTYHISVVYFCLVLIAVFITLAVISCFSVGTTLKNCLNSFVLGSTTFAKLISVFFLVTCGIRTSQVEHLMKKVTRMLAIPAMIDIELWHIRKL